MRGVGAGIDAGGVSSACGNYSERLRDCPHRNRAHLALDGERDGFGRPRRTNMKVNEIMTSEPRTCSPETSVAEAAQLMWNADCGILPVVEDGRLAGVVTDRDMYIALATRNVRASELKIRDVASTQVIRCSPDDDVQAALARMAKARVRRLPVVGFAESVVGILSIDDIVLAAGARKGIRNDDVVGAMKDIYGHHHVPVAVAV
jgi:CBS domain-containing protein